MTNFERTSELPLNMICSTGGGIKTKNRNIIMLFFLLFFYSYFMLIAFCTTL